MHTPVYAELFPLSKAACTGRDDDHEHLTVPACQSASALSQEQRLLLPSLTGHAQKSPEGHDRACAETSFVTGAVIVTPDFCVSGAADAVPSNDNSASAAANTTAIVFLMFPPERLMCRRSMS